MPKAPQIDSMWALSEVSPSRPALKPLLQWCQRVIQEHGGIKRDRVCGSLFTNRPLMFGFSKPFQHDVSLEDKRQDRGGKKSPQTCKLNVKGTLKQFRAHK